MRNPMKAEEIEEMLKSKIPGLDPHRPMLDQLDSVQLVVLVAEMESVLSISLRLEEINQRNMASPQVFAQFLAFRASSS